MVYQGSKNRISKYIVPIIQKYIDDYGAYSYIEPFVGGANVIDKINCESRIGSDINTELISLLKYMQDDNALSIAPEDCSFEHYSDVRRSRKENDGKYSTEYIALIGYAASYGGRYFDGGYGRDARGDRGIYKEGLKNMRKQAPNLNGIDFRFGSYQQYLGEYKNAVFYLDPPYKDTKVYTNQSINYGEFYDFCRELAKDNIVIISEYSMPSDFKCIWSKEKKVMQKSDRIVADKAVEKLFVIGDNKKY